MNRFATGRRIGSRAIFDPSDKDAAATMLRFKRILLKLSGEALMGQQGFGIDPQVLQDISKEIKEVHAMGVEVAIVIGGGNIFRGNTAANYGVDRVTADYMGMLATIMNGLALQGALEKEGVMTRLQTAIEMHQVAEPFIRRRAIRHLEKGRVVIFAGGNGNPFFTTDTTASLRAVEIGAEVILKATKVDGVYTADPLVDKAAVMYPQLTYLDVLKLGLKVMDSTAISLCMDNELPIIVFNLTVKGNIKRVLIGEPVGTVVQGG